MAPVAVLFCLTMLFLILQKLAPRLAGHDLTFLGFNLAFLAILMNGPALAWLGGFLSLCYLLALVAGSRRAANPFLFAVPAVILFAVFKKYEILPLQPLYAHIPEILGLSYIIFRVISVILEAHDTGIRPRIVPYLNFCLSMFTFLSGPIQSSRGFADDMERRRAFRLNGVEAGDALTRFLNGAIKVIYLAPVFQNMQDFFMDARIRGNVVVIRATHSAVFAGPLDFSGNLAPSLGFGLAALFYLLFLYFNFSGYTDMVLGLGRLLGFRLPENFDKPFVATSFLDFWKRWHISLSVWFRDHCFMPAWSVTRGPVSRTMMKMGVDDPAIATLPAYFISFGLLGLWHGRTWPFMLCGLMFAAGSSVNHLWRARMARVRNRESIEQINGNPLYRSFASALTLFYIAIAVTGLWLPDEAFGKAWRAFTPAQAVVSFALIVACLGAVLYWLRSWSQKRVAQQVAKTVHVFFSSETPRMMGFKVFLIVVWFFSFSSSLPDFVYKGF